MILFIIVGVVLFVAGTFASVAGFEGLASALIGIGIVLAFFGALEFVIVS